jgi:hypothetical protein
VSTGCFSYLPVRPESLTNGADAQVRLTLDGTRDVTGTLGSEVRFIRGIVERATSDSVVMRVREMQLLDGSVVSNNGTVVALGRQQMSDLERRTLSPGRTAVAGALVVGAIVLVAVAARPRGSQGEIIPPIGGPPAAIVPQ